MKLASAHIICFDRLGGESMSGFDGFSSDTISFLRDLKANNAKPWFDANRARYEAEYLSPAKDFVAAIGPTLQQMVPGISAEPRVNGSIFRVNRDIRFSKDKTPYKPHIDLWFWEGERKIASSGLFLRLAPDELILGAGAHGFPPDHLKRYRAAVAGKAGDALLEIDSALRSDGLTLRGEHYKKLPRGFETDNEDRARLLRHNALFAAVEGAHPIRLGSVEFLDHCLENFQRVLPVHRWLVATL